METYVYNVIIWLIIGIIAALNLIFLLLFHRIAKGIS